MYISYYDSQYMYDLQPNNTDMYTLTHTHIHTRTCSTHLIHHMSIHFVSDDQLSSCLCFAIVAGKHEAVQVVLRTSGIIRMVHMHGYTYRRVQHVVQGILIHSSATNTLRGILGTQGIAVLFFCSSQYVQHDTYSLGPSDWDQSPLSQ